MSDQPGVVMDIFRKSLGALLLGMFAQAIVYGIASSVTWTYFRRYAIDRGWFKAMVFIIWLACTFCLAVTIRSMYSYIVTDYMNTRGLQVFPWGVAILTTSISFVTTVVRFMFLNRLRLLYQAKGELNAWRAFYLCLIALLSLADLAVAITITVKMFLKPSIDTLTILWNLLVTIFAVGISADVILASMMCICLHMSRTGVQRTDSLINLLIIYTINTGLFPTLCAIATLISFCLRQDVLIYFPFYIQIPALYLIALVANLNHREVFRRQIQRPLTLDLSAFDMLPPTEGSQYMQRMSYPTPSFVHPNVTSGTFTVPSTPHIAADDKSSSYTQRFSANDASSCLERGPEREPYTRSESSEVILDSIADLDLAVS
ncbi:uncharacterized protein LAESUDRAFT_812069 [Laetiporus sulphureus 93-53]|uniref:DUF6534 domain-containing protein n=1 Tax=Laetiporus sulphureus 93-53 TaxID=1314785 RepID=A0A165EN03_9APHY|nr:uncharacterized protein LAESUDRAFT_812069 [Laetiporus sulphureus 93-53]KZT07402.1 hypothetical protein LAESUDRAFT_812069 [Laetiporus sulphureus 93-53]